jgi:membrane protein involved in colicin uptake
VEEKAKHEAEEKAKHVAEEKARHEAKEKAKKEAEEKAKKEVEGRPISLPQQRGLLSSGASTCMTARAPDAQQGTGAYGGGGFTAH